MKQRQIGFLEVPVEYKGHEIKLTPGKGYTIDGWRSRPTGWNSGYYCSVDSAKWSIDSGDHQDYIDQTGY